MHVLFHRGLNPQATSTGIELRDARKLTQEAQESLRLRAVKAVVESKKTCTEVSKILGVARGTVSRWVSVYGKKGKESSLLKKKRGRRSKDMVLLKPYQCATISTLIQDRCSDQLKLIFALWTRDAVARLIEQRFEIKSAPNTIGTYLKKWGFTAQKPLKRAYERQNRAVKHWLETDYPEIATHAKREKTEIHWGDEAGFRSDHQTVKQEQTIVSKAKPRSSLVRLNDLKQI